MPLKNPDRERQSDAAVYGRLLAYVLPFWGAFLLSVIGFAAYSLANVAFVQLVGYIVDSLGGTGSMVPAAASAMLKSWFGDGVALDRSFIPLAIVVIVIGRGMGTFVGNYFIAQIGTNLVHTLRCELFEQLLRLPSRFFDRSSMGHLVAKVTYHVTQVTGAATDAVTVIVREGFTVIGYLAFLFYLNWKLTLIFLAVAPLIAMLMNFAGRRFRRISERIQDSMGDVTQVASEAVHGYRVVRTFGGAPYERERFERVSNNNRRQSMKMVVTSSVSTPVVQLVVAIALALLVWLVLDPVLMAAMTPGDVVAFISTGGLLAKPIRQLSEVYSTVQKGLAAADDIFGLFDEAIEPDEGTRGLTGVVGKIEFRHVSFRYNDAEPAVLSDVSFVAEPGETIALVGRSGSGKSTLASLIPRFYSPFEGTILVDDIPIEAIKLADLRAQMSIVTQDVTLFNASIARNIAYGQLQDASVDAIRDAASRAYATGFIDALDDGLDTVVGDDGVLLSGGQRQRLAIARAFLKDAPILILDEATSALDSESERYIQRALDAVVKGRTTIVIAHRLSTIEKADRILVIDGGRIVEEGTHAELLARRGFYAALSAHSGMGEGGSATAGGRDVGRQRDVAAGQIQGTGTDDGLLVNAWYGDPSWPRLLAPLAYLFRQLSRYRRHWITSDPDRHWKAPVPVIVVGNITVGGTGKSPLVMWLAEQFGSHGIRAGIVSRGYGGSATQYPFAVDAHTDPRKAGDEAVMIRRRTGCPLVVAPDRVAAAKHLLAMHDCQVIISDDGLQHYALDRDVEIILIDAERGLGNGRCLPAGPLREAPARLREADYVVACGEGELSLEVATLPMRLAPTALVNVMTAERKSVNALRGSTIHAVAGIGNTDRFFAALRQLGYEIVAHRFPDHHRFDAADLTFADALPVVMTEKDAVKVRRLEPGSIHPDFWYLEVDVVMPADFMDGLMARVGLTRPSVDSG